MTEKVQITVGIPADDLEWIKAKAAEELRSMSAQIVMIIRQAREADQAEKRSAA